MYHETIIICVYDLCERRDRAALSDNRISCCFFVFVIWRRRDARRSRNEQKTRKTCSPTPTVSVLSARSVNHFRKKTHNASCTAAFLLYIVLYMLFNRRRRQRVRSVRKMRLRVSRRALYITYIDNGPTNLSRPWPTPNWRQHSERTTKKKTRSHELFNYCSMRSDSGPYIYRWKINFIFSFPPLTFQHGTHAHVLESCSRRIWGEAVFSRTRDFFIWLQIMGFPHDIRVYYYI